MYTHDKVRNMLALSLWSEEMINYNFCGQTMYKNFLVEKLANQALFLHLDFVLFKVSAQEI